MNRLELKQFTFSDNLSALLGEGIHFSNLVKFGMINCKLTRYDVGCLAQASVEGIFPLLAELDVSQNNDVCVTQDLFDLDCRWEKLTRQGIVPAFDAESRFRITHGFRRATIFH